LPELTKVLVDDLEALAYAVRSTVSTGSGDNSGILVRQAAHFAVCRCMLIDPSGLSFPVLSPSPNFVANDPCVKLACICFGAHVT
jgi:hypothetical protein